MQRALVPASHKAWTSRELWFHEPMNPYNPKLMNTHSHTQTVMLSHAHSHGMGSRLMPAALLTMGVVGIFASIYTLIGVRRATWAIPAKSGSHQRDTAGWRTAITILNSVVGMAAVLAVGIGAYSLYTTTSSSLVGKVGVHGLASAWTTPLMITLGIAAVATVFSITTLALSVSRWSAPKQPDIALALLDESPVETFKKALFSRRSISTMWRQKTAAESTYVNSMFTEDETYIEDTLNMFTMQDGGEIPPDLVNMVISGCQQNYWVQRTPWNVYTLNPGNGGWARRVASDTDRRTLSSFQCPTIANYWNGAVSTEDPAEADRLIPNDGATDNAGPP